jgi:hypothetical protein
MKDRIGAPLDLFDVKKLQGTHDLGFNGTGVIHTKLIIDSDYITTVDTMPARYVQQCMDEVKQLSENAKKRRPGGYIKGRLPMTLWQMWRRQWEQGPKLHGVLWRAFLNSKLMDSDYSKFRVDGV